MDISGCVQLIKALKSSKNIQWVGEMASMKGKIIDPAIHQFIYDECGRVCISNASFVSHKKNNIGRTFI